MTPISWSSLGLVAALWAAPAAAQDFRGVPRVLLDRRLQEKPVQLTGVNDKTLMYVDSTGQARTDAIGEYLAVLSSVEGAGGRTPPRPASVIELSDGQRFVGSLAASRKPRPDSILWEHAALGLLEFKLDDVRRVQLQGGPDVPDRRPGEDATDIVMLINGDRIEGYIDSIAGVISLDVNGTKRDLPADRVQVIVLGGGASVAGKPGVVAWLNDGSVVACRGIQTTRLGELILSPRTVGVDSGERGTEAPPPPAPTVSLRLDDLWALAVESGTLVPLASLSVAAQTPGPGRRWTRSAESVEPRWSALGLADVELPGPMSVEWVLPAGATRFATDAELPRQMWTWGDCEVVVSVVGPGETELWRKRVNAESPRARATVALPAGAKRLRIRVEAGEFGSVQDRVVLRRPVVGVEGM